MSGTGSIDTASPEWRLACLARHVCRMPTKADRHAFLDLMRKKQSPEFMATLEQKIRDEWVALRQFAQVNEGAHVDS